MLVATNSPCEKSCGNVLDGLSADQVVCDDAAYSSSFSGQVFKSCVTCETTSTYLATDGNQTQSDLGSMLWNMRYAANQCIFHSNDYQICSTSRACEPFKAALEYGNFSTSVLPYGYCSQWGDADFLTKCSNCLLASNSPILRNFISVLDGACTELVQPPNLISLDGGSIFSNSKVNVTESAATEAVHTHNTVGPLTYGALAGIVIGGVVVLLALVGCGVVINGKRHRKRYLRKREDQMRNWPTPQAGGGDMFETPISQRPLRGGGWGDSPISAATADGSFPQGRYFSPYSSQYNSPVSAVDGPGNMMWPQDKAHSIGVAISPDNDASYSPWSDHKGKDRERAGNNNGYGTEDIELNGPISHPHEVYNPPILRHPGYGRYTDVNPINPAEGEGRSHAVYSGPPP
ncbi:hypothetical protein GGR57DRAFT_473085 [Xylariaceae sp. FL1272]|nr:hypothetical protein GGR57DRAFT_473085 [Xylariaceae sp. FL1272]